jgi:hypothetical protein
MTNMEQLIWERCAVRVREEYPNESDTIIAAQAVVILRRIQLWTERESRAALER